MQKMIQAGLDEAVRALLAYRVDVTFVFTSFTARNSDHNWPFCILTILYCRGSWAEAEPPHLHPRFPGFCKLSGSPRTTGIAKHCGDTKLHIAHGLKLMQIMFLYSLSQKPPELCINIDPKVNLGSGELNMLETPVSMHGKNMPMWSARRILQKKH